MLQDGFHVPERRACRLIGQPRGTQRYLPTQAIDEDALTQAIVAVTQKFGLGMLQVGMGRKAEK